MSGCVPSCTGLSCGSDGCGGSCGTCAGAQTCNGSGVCVGGSGTVGSGTCPDYTPCLSVDVEPTVTSCESDGYHLIISNSCSYDVEYEFCFQKLDNSCDCGEDTIPAEYQMRDSPGDFACDATGQIQYLGTSPASWGMCTVLDTCE